ncbi:MAG: ABC transporter substrate-binding protein [Actinomycetota bacterium]
MSGIRRLAIGLSLVVAVAACGSDDDDTAEAVTTVAETTVAPTTSAAAPATSEATDETTTTLGTAEPAADFPATVVGDAGELTVQERPVAIVSLSPSLTEMLFAMGAGEQVVAVDGSSNFPEGTPMTDLSGFRPNVEAIGALRPDLVLLARDRDDVVATLDTVGIPALVLGSAGDIATVAEQIRVLGQATGNVAAAEQLADDVVAGVDAAFATLEAPADEVTYYVELSGEYNSSTSDSLIGALSARAGIVNIADGVDPAAGPFPQLSAEFVLETDPDLIFVAHTDGSVPTLDDLVGRPGWADLSAVAGDDIVFLDPNVASRWGPRVVELATSIATAVAGVGPG